MRGAILLLVLSASVMPSVALGQSAPLLRTVATHVQFPVEYGSATYSLQCPAGYVPTGFSSAPAYQFDINVEVWRDMVDSGKAVVDRRTVTSAAALDGAGFAALVQNTEHHSKHLEIMVTCLSPAATSDNTLVLSSSAAMVPRTLTGVATSFCPADYPVAVGGFSNADGRTQLLDAGAGPVWGTSANPLLLYNLPDGQTGPPTGWQVRVLNQNGFNAQEIIGTAVCGKVPGLQTFIYSASVPQSVFSRTPFSIFAPVPDGWSAIGQGYAGGSGGNWPGEYYASDAWNQDGVIVNALQYNLASRGYDSGPAEVRAFITHGLGAAPPGGGVRAVMAVLAVPKPSSAAAIIEIVEYYHAALDHYFITGIRDEITKLDNGTFVGWQRTGQTFRAYAAGSGGGNTGRRPVCRAYGKPEVGLDTHFYSASPDECNATLLNGVSPGTDPVRTAFWGLEASEVFQMDLPDATTGACPAGGVPIYRVWNKRIDSNHRYTTSIAIRDQMVARGGVAEGYGPNAVALCGLT